MKKLFALVLWALFLPTICYAQGPTQICFTSNGKNCIPVSATNPFPVLASASITGFTALTTGTPISVITGGVSGTLPVGAVVVATNVGATNGAYCALGASATTSSQYLSPGGGWFAFTVGASTQLTCITSTSTTTVNMTGGSGLPTGTGGGGGSLSGTTSNASSAVATSSTNLATIGYLYGFNGTTWDQVQVDASKNVKVVATGLAIGSTTSGSTGSLVFCATTTTITGGSNAQNNPLNCTPAGALRNDLSTIVGTAADVNSGNKSAGTLRVVLATDQPSLTNSLSVINGATSAVNTIAASQSAQVLSNTSGGGTGATGDYLSHCVVIPTSTSPGIVSIIDNATTVVPFPGGASSISNLVPFIIPIGSKSVSGAWKVTTGANLSVSCVGKFS